MRTFFYLLFLVTNCLFSQDFEGRITYRMELLNPNPDKVSKEQWDLTIKNQLGQKGYIEYNNYYKENYFFSEISAGNEKGYQAIDNEDGLIYSWEEGSLQAVSLNSRVFSDKILSIQHLDTKEEVFGLNASILVITSQIGTTKIWYVKDKFKMNPDNYEGYEYNFMHKILKETGALPLKIERKQTFIHTIETINSYEEMKLGYDKFDIPQFSNVIINPNN